jgi:hypothetical protein
VLLGLKSWTTIQAAPPGGLIQKRYTGLMKQGAALLAVIRTPAPVGLGEEGLTVKL